MARVLGYGGLANTNGARDFSSKVGATLETASTLTKRFYLLMYRRHPNGGRRINAMKKKAA